MTDRQWNIIQRELRYQNYIMRLIYVDMVINKIIDEILAEEIVSN